MGMMKNTSATSNRPLANPSNLVSPPSSIMSRMNAANVTNAPKATNLHHPMVTRRSIPESSSSAAAAAATSTTTTSPSSIPTPAVRHPSQEGGKGTTIGEIRRSHQSQGNDVMKTGTHPSTVVMPRLSHGSHESHDLEDVIRRLDAIEQRMQQLDSISDQLNMLMVAVNKLSRQM